MTRRHVVLRKRNDHLRIIHVGDGGSEGYVILILVWWYECWILFIQVNGLVGAPLQEDGGVMELGLPFFLSKTLNVLNDQVTDW